MSNSLHDIIQANYEPPLLVALHWFKIVILLAPIFLIMLLVGPLLGTGVMLWACLLFASVAGSILSAVIANKWSESLFVRQAESHGIDVSEAQEFYRTYDWDGVDA